MVYWFNIALRDGVALFSICVFAVEYFMALMFYGVAWSMKANIFNHFHTWICVMYNLSYWYRLDAIVPLHGCSVDMLRVL